jgi:hypothetical protein
MEQDAAALFSPNISALAGLTGAADLGLFFTGLGALSTYSLSSAGRSLSAAADAAAQQAALSWAAAKDSPAFIGTPTAPTPAVGTGTTQIATAEMIQDEIANARAWTPYTPTITPLSGSFTSASVAARYLVVFGICYVQIVLTVTTKGTGEFPTLSLPFPALSGSAEHLLPCRSSTGPLALGQAKINSALTGIQITRYDSGELTADGTNINVQGFYPIA